MTHDIDIGDTAGRSRLKPGAPDQVDRILVAGCIVLWLAALGAAVAAIVALVDLARGHQVSSGGGDTPWLLYTVIGVSAAVIACAIPLLIRARQAAAITGSTGRQTGPADTAAPAAGSPAAQRLTPFGAPVQRRHPIPPATSRVAFPAAAVDQVWLRFTTVTAGAIGAALTGVGVATYLMASGHDVAAWSVYAVAGLITVAMPAVSWWSLRQLHAVLDASEPDQI